MSEDLKKKILEVINVSGQPVDPKEWEKGDKALALKLAHWFSERKCMVAISTTDDGAIILDYAYNNALQPSVRIYSGKIIWPRGTDFDLMMAFLEGK